LTQINRPRCAASNYPGIATNLPGFRGIPPRMGIAMTGICRRLGAFWQDEDGAATVDWVVLTAAGLLTGIAVMGEVRDGVEDLSRDIDATLRMDNNRTSFDDPAPAPAPTD
jgi:Flp pilus assembly pilin Flp